SNRRPLTSSDPLWIRLMLTLTGAALSAVVGAVFGHLAKVGVQLALPEDRLRAWLGRDPVQLAFQVALARAFTTFARHYPQFATSFFDRTFLSGRAAPLLARCLTTDGSPDPAEL